MPLIRWMPLINASNSATDSINQIINSINSRYIFREEIDAINGNDYCH